MITKMNRLMKSIISKLITSTKRFPEALLFASSAVFIAIYMNHMDFAYPDPLRQQLSRLTMVLALGIPLFLSIRVFIERINLKKSTRIISFVTGGLLLIGYYTLLLQEINSIARVRYIGISIALYLAFTCIPYLFKRQKYELYVVKLLTKLFITYLYSIVLFLGLSAMLFTIDQLFAVNVSHRLYLDIFLIVVGIFAPAYFLADIPAIKEDILLEDYPKVLRVLLQYIVMPLLVAYSTILYVYFGKVLITRQWPHGMVSHLVLWFSIISTLVIFLVYQLKEQNQWINIFERYFPKWILPLLAMMFVAIGIRVKAYGITESRYLVIVVGLWVLGSMLYLSFIKKKANVLLAFSLVAVALVSVFGPLSAFSVSKYSQNNRFVALLQENQMLQTGSIVKPEGQLSERAKEDITSIVAYFNSRHSLKELKYWPEEVKIEDSEELLGFKVYDGIRNHRNYFHIYANDNKYIVNISDYDLFSNMIYYRHDDVKTVINDEYTISFSKDSDQLELFKGSQLVYTKDIKEMVKAFYKFSGKQNLSIEELMYEDNVNGLKVMYLFKSISGFEADTELNVDSAEFYIFIKLP